MPTSSVYPGLIKTIQIEVTKDNLHYGVQLGHPENKNPDKQLYKDEAIKIIKALITTYSND